MNLQHMKRITAISMALLMASTMSGTIGTNNETVDFSISASAVGIKASGTCGVNGSNLKWTLNSNGILTITGSGRMKDYEYKTAPWYKNDYAENISKIILPDQLVSIGKYAFVEMTNLREIQTNGKTTGAMPSYLTEIGSFAFAGCANLCGYLKFGVSGTDLTVNIGRHAFEDCDYIQSISSDTSIDIAEYAFQKMDNLKMIDFSHVSAAVGKCAFKDCPKLQTVNIRLSNQPIHKFAFRNTPYDSNGCVASTTAGARDVGSASTMTGLIRVVNIFVDQAIKNSDGTYRLSGNWGLKNVANDHNGLVYNTTKSDSNCVKSLNSFNYTSANDTTCISQSVIDNGTSNFLNKPVTSTQIATRLEQVRTAMNNLQKQAKNYGQWFTWDMSPATNYYVTLYLPDQPNNTIEKNSLTSSNPLYANNPGGGQLCKYLKETTSGDVDLSTGYTMDCSVFTNKLREKGYDSVIYLVHNNMSCGQSCSFAKHYNQKNTYAEEWAVISNNRSDTYTTIAHETCHLFGAMDYYSGSGNVCFNSDFNLHYFAEAFPKYREVMYDCYGPTIVSPLTAFSIGWTYNLDAKIYNDVFPYSKNY